jgi:nucleosome binding factor SPN SPT16 subunit
VYAYQPLNTIKINIIERVVIVLHRYDLADILYKSLQALGGSSNIVEVCKFIWDNYKSELESSGDLFYTWQYDIRWAATQLRKAGKMKDFKTSPQGIWEIIQ